MKKKANEILDSKYFGEIGIETTNKCNLRCSYCFNESSIKNEEYIGFETICSIIDQAKKLSPIPVITFSGGEFFMYKYWIQALEYISEVGIPFKLITNGTLLSDEIVEKLSAYKIELLQISLDGSTEEQNVLRGSGNVEKIIKLLQTISKYQSLRDVTAVRMTVSKANIDMVEDSIAFFNSLGFRVRMGYLFSMGRGIDNPYILNTDEIYALHTRLYDLKSNKTLDFDMPVLSIYAPCNLIEKDIPLNVRIKPNGDMFACFGVDSCSFKLANVNDVALADIIKGNNLLNVIEYMLNRHEIMRDGQCKHCVAKDICKGGCVGHSLYENDDAYEPPKRLCTAADLFSRRLLVKNNLSES